MINYKRFIPLTKETKIGEIQVIKDSVENKTYANVYSICDLMNIINDKMMFHRTTIDKRIVELEEKNKSFSDEIQRLNKVINLMEYQLKVQDRIIKEYEDGESNEL